MGRKTITFIHGITPKHKCKKCNRIRHKNYENKNKKKIANCQRHNRLTTINKLGKRISVSVEKRAIPKDFKCELCNKVKWLIYHHWLIKDKKAYGLWLCGRCHRLAEIIEQNLIENFGKKYLKLKEKINNLY